MCDETSPYVASPFYYYIFYIKMMKTYRQTTTAIYWFYQLCDENIFYRKQMTINFSMLFIEEEKKNQINMQNRKLLISK